jgi:hypothetical protein
MIKLLGYTVAVVVVVGLILCIPFATIWMINVFGDYLWPGRQLPYAWDTWLASALLSCLFASGLGSGKKKG